MRSFSADGSKLAYLKIASNTKLEEEQQALDSAPAAERPRRLAVLNESVAVAARLTVRDVASGSETEIDIGTLRKAAPAIAVDGSVLFVGGPGADSQIYSVAPGREPRALTPGPEEKSLVELNATGTAAIVTVRGAGTGGRGGFGAAQAFGILTLPDGGWTPIEGSSPSFSADGRSFVYLTRAPPESQILVAATATPASPTVVRKGAERVDAPALSRDGARVAFQMMPRDDWEIYTSNARRHRRAAADARDPARPVAAVSSAPTACSAVIGEPRHRRSYIYDLDRDGTPHAALPQQHRAHDRPGVRRGRRAPTARKLLIGAERDGDTVSPERGVYVMDLSRTRSRGTSLRARVAANLAAERALRGQRRAALRADCR